MNPRPKLVAAHSAPSPVALPARVRVQHRYGYIDEETGRSRMWEAGDMIVDAGEIALLVGRGAPLDVIE